MKTAKFIASSVVAVCLLAAPLASGQSASTDDKSSTRIARTEVRPIQTMTLTDEQF